MSPHSVREVPVMAISGSEVVLRGEPNWYTNTGGSHYARPLTSDQVYRVTGDALTLTRIERTLQGK